jgi:tetratricopeptide (TPR) repeat protein
MLEDWISAAEDAGKAVQADPRDAKAQLRKGCVRHACTSAAACALVHSLQAAQMLRVYNPLCMSPCAIRSLSCDPVCRVASFNLEEYETAMQAFDAAAALEPNKKSYHSWTAKCKAALDSETLLTYYHKHNLRTSTA